MQIPDPVADDVRHRVARAEGQLHGIQKMLPEQRDCRDVGSEALSDSACRTRCSASAGSSSSRV